MTKWNILQKSIVMTFWTLLLISTFSSLKTNKIATFVQGGKTVLLPFLLLLLFGVSFPL